MRITVLSLLCSLLVSFQTAVSFIPVQPLSQRSLTSVFASSDAEQQETIWTTKNDFRTFLNQCTIQSFLFLIRQMRDIQTVMFIEEYTEPSIEFRTHELANDLNNYQTGEFVEPSQEEQQKSSKLLRYHGLGALNMTLFPTWETYFLELLKKDKEVWKITSPKPHVPDYDWEVNPASLCTRMISVREQIAKEWVRDLEVIANLGGQVMESYWDSIRNAGSVDPTIERQFSLLFLEWDPNEDSDFAPSPLRKGNFDLLELLTTQEAIHRLLNDKERAEGDAAVANKVLEDFYFERLGSHFTGGQRYSRANDFLSELLATPPSTITVGGTTALIDTMGLAENILHKRQEVALEWREIARGSPEEHYDIRRSMLNKLMGIDISENADN